jgi:eukaryotic-like serine/threonine-protein kinase
VTDLVGTRLGNYVIRRELGAGGMGTVYLAEHPELGRKLAIKVLHDDSAVDPDTVARFFQEARAAAEIGQENIIEVHDVGTVDAGGRRIVYLMMELLEGESLGARLRRGRPDDDETRGVLRQCCAALAASHAHGIVHRDIKPENIYLVRRGGNDRFVKVLDFGIAKLVHGPGSGRTRIGTVIGTPEYMSPEQCLGRGDVDERADVYSLGVVLYEMLCGDRPFSGTLGEILQAHVQAAPVPPSQRATGVSAELEAIALRCLAKRKEDRFQSMDELASALDRPRAGPDAPTVHLAPGTAISAPVALERHARARGGWRAWLAPVVVGAIAVGAVIASVVAIRGARDARITEPTQVPDPAPVLAQVQPAAAIGADAAPPAVDAAAVVEVIAVRIVSEPAGARVHAVDRGDVIDGVAPLVIERPADAPPLEVTLILRGHHPVTRRIAPVVDSELLIVMPPAPAPPRKPTRPRTRPRPAEVDDPDDIVPPPWRR